MEDELLDLYLDLVRQAEALEIDILVYISQIAEGKVENPFSRIDYRQIGQAVGDEVDSFIEDVDQWTYGPLAVAYLQGLKSVNEDIVEFGIPINETAIDPERQLFLPDGNPKQIPGDVLEDWPGHRDAFSVLSESTDQQFSRMRTTVVRDVQDKVRRIAVEASEDFFVNAETSTQREFMDRLMKDFADEGIEAVRYRNGAKMGLRGYTEMTSRTMVNNAARQGALNRQTQIGEDLVRMSSHYPTCELCAPWQGGIYSISGNSDYPPLSTVKGSGAFHPNCKHSVSPYYEDISVSELPGEKFSRPRNREMNALQSRQRAMERYIRKYKKRRMVSLDPEDQAYLKQKVDKWQGKLKELTNEHDFLRYQGYRTRLTEPVGV